MADKKDSAQGDKKAGEQAAPAKSKKPIFIGGGALVLVALAYVFSTMAVPKHEVKVPTLAGPFVAKLSKTDIQVNLSGESSKRYLVMKLNAEYFAYDEAYVQGRLGGIALAGSSEPPKEDPLYIAMLKDALLKVSATKSRDEVTNPTLMDGFLEEIRTVVNPILFPVHVGDSHAAMTPDTLSGLRVGESVMDSTMRGFLHEHALAFDGAKRSISLDDGPTVTFDGTERDLKLTNKAGLSVFVDVTDYKPEFAGDVPIGVPGRVRRIYRDSFLVQ
jgi:flagellar basal body-associated protein FliL